ncbi:MAG: ATP-binding cassette domain-containing protein [Actinomycetota bacterium]
MSAIVTRDLRRRFGDEEAVAGVDLHVDRGEIYGFLGPNGAGKSTTVRMLCTLLAPTAGMAEVAGLNVVDNADEVRLRIGVALQEAALDDKQTGREILELQGRLYGMSGPVLAKRIDAVLEFVDIGDAIDRRVGTYSGGMKRRVDLASALLHEPEVLFLDEPTTGLDPVSRSKVWEEVSRLQAELGVTIFLTTQYLEEADALAERVGIIDEGRLVAQGTPEDLKRDVGQDLVVVEIGEGSVDAVPDLSRLAGVTDVAVHGTELSVSGADGAALVSDLVVALNQADVQVTSLTLRTPTLDDVFLAVTGHRIEPGEDSAAVAAGATGGAQ